MMTRTVLGILSKYGTMAEYITLPLSNLHEVPSHVSDEHVELLNRTSYGISTMETLTITGCGSVLP